MIPELFAMFDTANVEIKKEHHVLMVSETTSFEKGKGKKGSFMNGKPVAALVQKPKVGPKPESKCFYNKGNSHWQRNCPRYLADKKTGNVNRSIFDIRVIDVYLTSTPSSTGVLDTGSVANVSNSE